jgi:type IV pilus biogenesis protein CpaD/CtpE
MPQVPPPVSADFLSEPVSARADIRFAPGATELNAAERARAEALLDRLAPDRLSLVTIGASGPLAEPRRRAVLAVVRAQTDAKVQFFQDGNTDRVTLVVQRDALLPEACVQGPMPADGTLPPFGCVTALNLVNTVADPADLREGRELGPALAGPVARAADRYLSGETAELPYEETSQ